MELRWIRRFTGYQTQLVLQQLVNTNIPIGLEFRPPVWEWQDIPIVEESSNNTEEKK